MKTIVPSQPLLLSAALACALSLPVRAELILNGGFEAGFSNWTLENQLGSEGAFFLQSGAASPVLGLPVAPPPEGLVAAMTDAEGPGAHVLYQDFLVPIGLPSTTLSFWLFINNDNGAPDFFTPDTLDFATPALNQRARVDLMWASADPFSLDASDILQALFETAPGDPLVSGYNHYTFDVTALLQAHAGATLRLRFAEVDNVAPFNFGVDRVSIAPATASVPDHLPWMAPFLVLAALGGAGAVRRRAA